MKTLEVLVVEDNAEDRFWLEYALRSLRANYSLSAVADGSEAVDFLLKQGKHAEAPTPDLIFLDVHLPMLNGIEVLRRVPHARELPICVVTSSAEERSAFEQEFGIDDSNYLLKPVSQESLVGSSRCQECLRADAQTSDDVAKP